MFSSYIVDFKAWSEQAALALCSIGRSYFEVVVFTGVASE
jgi:hypothetical protein